MAFYQVEPFGPERLDLAAAIIASTYVETKRDHKKRQQPYTAKDFLPRWNWEEPEPLEVQVPQEDLISKTMDIFRRLGGTVAKRAKKG